MQHRLRQTVREAYFRRAAALGQKKEAQLSSISRVGTKAVRGAMPKSTGKNLSSLLFLFNPHSLREALSHENRAWWRKRKSLSGARAATEIS